MDKIGIVTAMAVEADALRTYIKNEEDIASPFSGAWQGTIGGQNIIVIKSGAGKVCATMATQWLIDHLQPSALFNIGIAGSLKHDTPVGSVIIGRQFVQHDFMPAPWLGRVRGEIPFVGERSYPRASPLLSDKIELVARSLDIKSMHGTILSGDEPIFDEARRDALAKLFEHFNPLAVDMESAAFAFTAAENNIPFAVIRAIADRASKHEKPAVAGGNASANGTAGLVAQITAQLFSKLN